MNRKSFVSLLLSMGLYFGSSTSWAEGFDFTNDPDVIKEQVQAVGDKKNGKKGKEEQRVLNMQYMEAQIKACADEIAGLERDFAVNTTDPLDYEGKFRSRITQLAQYRFGIQGARGQIQYASVHEKNAILHGGTVFDDMLPNAVSLLHSYVNAVKLQGFAKKYRELRAMIKWWNAEGDRDMETLFSIDSALAQGQIKSLNNWLRVSSSPFVCRPRGKGTRLLDLDAHLAKLSSGTIEGYGAAYDAITRSMEYETELFTGKWKLKNLIAEGLKPPFSTQLGRIFESLDAIHNHLDNHRATYGTILEELRGNSGLGGFANMKPQKYVPQKIRFQKGKTYTEIVCRAVAEAVK